MGYSVSITGIPQLRRRLVDRIPAKMREAVSTAMVAGGGKVTGLARTLVPRYSGELAGTIRSSEVRVSKRGGLYVAITAGDESTIERGYQKARLVEFGTVEMPAQPYLLPAFRAHKRSIRAAITRAAKKAAAEN